MSELINGLVIAAFALSVMVSGYSTAGSATVTLTALCLVVVLPLILIWRKQEGLPPIAMVVLRQPAVALLLIYFIIGVATGTQADDKVRWFREIVQRTLIIWLPIIAVTHGLRNSRTIAKMLLCYMPFVALIVLPAIKMAAKTGFSQEAYVIGLHKNMLAGLAATGAIIAIAYLMSSTKKQLTIGSLSLPNRPIMCALLAACLLGVLGAQGRGGLLEIVAALYLILFAAKAKPRTFVVLTLTLVAGGVLALKLLPEKAVEHVVTTKHFSANGIRLALWTEMWAHISANPLLCVGWGNPLIDEHGFFYYDVACVYLFDWMQMGPLGPLAFLASTVAALVLGFQNAQKFPVRSPEGFVNLAAIGIVAGKYIHGLLDTFWIGRGHTFHMFFAVGIIVFIKLLASKQAQTRYQATTKRTLAKLSA